MRFGKLLVALALLASVSSRALASTIIVDVNGTGQFTNIPPAIAAAQDGDVIIVLQGNYSQFSLTKSLTIVGVGNVSLGNGSTLGISGIPSGNRAVVANLRASHLTIAACAGHVVAQDISAPAGVPFTLAVTNSVDVRLRGIYSQQTFFPQTSRIELAHCAFQGHHGYPGGPAEAGIWCSLNGNRLHLALTTATGGNGADDDNGYAGDGQTGMLLGGNDTAIFAGGGLALMRGGDGGQGPGHPSGSIPCYYDGSGGYGVLVPSGSSFRHSGGTFTGGSGRDPYTCQTIVQPGIAGSGTVVAATPDDPTLDFVGWSAAGAGVQFVVRAPPGSQARLNFGRAPILIADGLAVIERLAPSARVVNLGAVPASGMVTLNWTIPALPTGTFLVSQAEVVLQGGELRRTNSVPVVIR